MINIEYGPFGFSPQPVPFISISKEYVKSANDLNVTTDILVTLEGKIVKETGGLTSSIVDVALEMENIRNAFNQDGLLFLGSLDNNVFFSGYPRIRSLSFAPSPDNWVATAPYIIELEFDTTDPTEDVALLPPYLQSKNENWSIEPLDENYSFTYELPDSTLEGLPYKFRVSHEVSAVGKAAYNIGGLIKEPWEWAKQHVTGLLGYDHTKVSQQGSVTFNLDLFGQFNHSRVTHINKKEGGVSVNESWLVLETGIGVGLSGNAIENFNINVNQGTADGFTKINIEGEIRGLANTALTGGDISVVESAYTAASGYWNYIQNKLFQRAKLIGDDLATRSLHPVPVNNTVGHHPCEGIISYTYEYDDRPALCVSNALREEIEIIDNNPVDIYGSLTILGRAVGPILQQMNTITAPSRSVLIDITIEPATGCPTGVNFSNWFSQKPTGVQELIDDLEADLTGNYSKVFKTNDTEDWRATEGQYTRNVSWTYTDC